MNLPLGINTSYEKVNLPLVNMPITTYYHREYKQIRTIHEFMTGYVNRIYMDRKLVYESYLDKNYKVIVSTYYGDIKGDIKSN